MAPRKTIAFILPSLLLFAGLGIFLFRNLSQYPFILLLLFPFVLTIAVGVSVEMASLMAAIATFLEVAALGMVPIEDKPWVGGQILLIWAGLYLAHRLGMRDITDEKACGETLRDRQQSILSLQKEKQSIETRLVDMDKQVALRRHLANAVHELASLLDPVMIRQRLMEFVRSTIGKGTIHFFAGSAPRDLMDKWVMERRLSLLVTDIAQDNRFQPVRSGNEVRSILAAPIVVERQVVGILRLNGFEPGLFTIGDLRILEALSLLASLALENLQLLAKLREGAIRDNLTGLYTHRFFQDRLADEVLRAGRYKTEFAILLMDIDHFKRYNDTYGHAAGDQVLVRVSQVLQEKIRSVDLVARYGGEEFVVVMPQASMDQAREMAERIRQTIMAESFNFGPETTMQEHVTISIGLAAFPNEATIASQLVRVADQRLYQAKENGRNRVIG